MWLERESASVVIDFQKRASSWGGWLPAAGLNLPLAFAKRQEGVWKALHQDALQRLKPLLQVFIYCNLTRVCIADDFRVVALACWNAKAC